MRSWLTALAVSVALTASACSPTVGGVALVDPHRPSVALTDDGYGILVGDPDATVRLEQCPACAALQHRFGDDIRTYLMTGQIAVTYNINGLDDVGAAGTPTVYNLTTRKIIDTSGNDWLDNLLRKI